MTINVKELKKLYEQTPVMSTEEYVEYFKVLGDKVRHLVCREIFTHPGLSGKEILVKFHVTQPTLSFHIAQLIRAGLIVDKRDGQRHLYYPNYQKILSFHKTNAVYHMEIEGFLGKIYETMLDNMKKIK